jgi:hypothetical protein
VGYDELGMMQVRTEPELYIATMDNKLHSYHVKGKKNWSLQLPAPVTAMTRALVRRSAQRPSRKKSIYAVDLLNTQDKNV